MPCGGATVARMDNGAGAAPQKNFFLSFSSSAPRSRI
jgi:hypothetical protein